MLISVTAVASDYKKWISLLPDNFGGMPRSGKPDGMNMEISGKLWSSLHQKYASDNSEKHIELTLVEGIAAPLRTSFKMMSSMKMETDDQIIKTVNVSGRRGVVNLEKNEKRGILMIPLSEEMIVVIEATHITTEAQIITLAEELPLDKFAAPAK